MMVRTFTEHLGATLRTRFFLASDALLMFCSFSTFRADTESAFTHIVPAFLYHQLLPVLRKTYITSSMMEERAIGVSTQLYVMISATTNNVKTTASCKGDLTTAS